MGEEQDQFHVANPAPDPTPPTEQAPAAPTSEPTNGENPQEGISTITGILLLLLIALLAGGGVWAYYNYRVIPDLNKASTSTTTTPKTDETANWKTLTLDFSKATLKYPETWKITRESGRESGWENNTKEDISFYMVNKKETESNVIGEYANLTKWSNYSSNEPYTMPSAERKQALTLMKEIYSNQKLAPELINRLSKFSIEFFPYNGSSAISWKYIASTDNKSRGFSCINTSGQDVGIYPTYYVVLFNQDENAVVNIDYSMSSFTKETKALNDQLNNTALNQQEIVNTRIHAEFKTLIESKTRSQLSFGELMDTIDLAMKSLKF